MGLQRYATFAVLLMMVSCTEPIPGSCTDNSECATPMICNVEINRCVSRLQDPGPPSVPHGAIMAFAGKVVPDGWLPCDGAAVLRSRYQALFNVLGDTWGAGDGTTTFNLPNLSGRFALGENKEKPLATQGGNATHTLTVDQMPAHAHSGMTDGKAPAIPVQVLSGNANSYAPNTADWVAYTWQGAANVHYHAFATNSVGGSLPHPIMPPFTAIKYIIKY